MTNLITTIPAENEIVCGRGKGFDLLPANQTFRRIIAENAARYSGFRKSRTEKSILIRLIAHQLKMDNMRFVRRTKQGWKALLEHEVNLKIGHALRDVAPLQQKSQRRACTKNPLQSKGKLGFRREMRHTRVVSFSSAGEASVAFPPKAGLPDQSDVHSIVDVSLFDHHSTVASVTCRDQDSQRCVPMNPRRCNAYHNEREEISIFQSDNSNGRLQFNVIDVVADSSFLNVPMEEVYLDFVNDKGDEFLDFPSHDISFEV